MIDYPKFSHLLKNDEALSEFKDLLQKSIDENGYLSIEDFAPNNNSVFLILRSFSDSGQESIKYSKSVLTVLGIDDPSSFKGHHSLIIEEDVSKVKKIFADVKNNKNLNSFSISYRLKVNPEKLIWLKENASVTRTENGNVTKIESSVVNITDFVEREEAVITLKDQYKEKNSAKDKFISIVSHDLRAPFTSLLGFSEILLKENDLDENEKREYLEYIFDAAKSELQMINDLLDWSRLQTGKINIQPNRIRLYDVINNSISSLTGNAIRKNIEIKTDVNKDFYVLADDRLLSQSVKNLLSNAIKFTPREKNIYVSSSKFNEGVIEVIVRDEGKGIQEIHQDKIFRIDEKFTLEGTDGEKGSGLGLALVKEIVEKHNGEIWFYSKENEGTEFHFTLPIAKTKIVIVEDDENARKLLKKIVRSAVGDCDIVEAANGYEALTIIVNEPPSLLISDHEMPLMNGIQLIEAVNKKLSIPIPVVVISARLNEELTKKYNVLGVEKILTKPIDSAELSQVITQLLE